MLNAYNRYHILSFQNKNVSASFLPTINLVSFKVSPLSFQYLDVFILRPFEQFLSTYIILGKDYTWLKNS